MVTQKYIFVLREVQRGSEHYVLVAPVNLEGPRSALAYAMGNEASFFAFPTYARLVKLL